MRMAGAGGAAEGIGGGVELLRITGDGDTDEEYADEGYADDGCGKGEEFTTTIVVEGRALLNCDALHPEFANDTGRTIGTKLGVAITVRGIAPVG